MSSENSCPSNSKQILRQIISHQISEPAAVLYKYCRRKHSTLSEIHTKKCLSWKHEATVKRSTDSQKRKHQTLYKNRDASTMLNPEDLGWGLQLATGETAQASAHWWDDARHIRSCLSCPRPEEPGQRAGTTSWTRPLDEGSHRRCGLKTQGIGAAAPGPLGRAEWRWSEETPPPALGSSLICGAALVGLCSGRHLGQGASNWRASFSPDE